MCSIHLCHSATLFLQGGQVQEAIQLQSSQSRGAAMLYWIEEAPPESALSPLRVCLNVKNPECEITRVHVLNWCVSSKPSFTHCLSQIAETFLWLLATIGALPC